MTFLIERGQGEDTMMGRTWAQRVSAEEIDGLQKRT